MRPAVRIGSFSGDLKSLPDWPDSRGCLPLASLADSYLLIDYWLTEALPLSLCSVAVARGPRRGPLYCCSLSLQLRRHGYRLCWERQLCGP